MDVRAFIVEMVRALAWPVAAVVGLLMLRKPIKDLMALLTQLKYGQLEVNFGKGVQNLERKAAAALPPQSPSMPEIVISSGIAKLAEESPRAAVIEAWIRVKDAALGALKRRGVRLSREKHVAPQEVETALREHNLLDDAQLAVLRQLRNLRNAAVHGPAFSLDAGAALQYSVTANRLATLLERKSA